MPYAPDVQYRGDQYAFQGITNLGNTVSDELKKYLELKKQGNLNDTIIQHAVQTGRIKPDEYNNYIQANWTKKQGIANGLIANMADDWQRQMFAQKEDKSAELANALQIAQLQRGSAEKIAQMNIDAGKFAGAGGGPVVTDPLIDPTTQKPVPGYGIVRKTGNVVPTSADVPQVILDPTKKFEWKGPKAGWQALNSKLARQLADATAGDAPMTPPPTGFSLLHPSTWMGGTPSPTPAPTVTPPDIPAAQGVTPGPAYPAATAPGAQVDAAAARAQAQAKINAGADRDAIIARLKQLGVDSSGL